MSNDTQKHTPGPWITDGLSIETCDSILEGRTDLGGVTVARVFPPSRTQVMMGIDAAMLEAIANAFLIAAAPELLKASRHAAEMLTLHADPLNEPLEMETYIEMLDKLSAVIAKAEGRA